MVSRVSECVYKLLSTELYEAKTLVNCCINTNAPTYFLTSTTSVSVNIEAN